MLLLIILARLVVEEVVVWACVARTTFALPVEMGKSIRGGDIRIRGPPTYVGRASPMVSSNLADVDCASSALWRSGNHRVSAFGDFPTLQSW